MSETTQFGHDDPFAYVKAMHRIAALQAELAEARRDGERLDWVLEKCWIEYPCTTGDDCEVVDIYTREEIDAARGGVD